MIDLTQPLTPAARQALLELLETINGEIRRLRQRLAHLPWSKQWTDVSSGDIKKLVALVEFHPGEGPLHLSLAEVPTVMLGECWNDMRLIAAEGTGFDPNWEAITVYK